MRILVLEPLLMWAPERINNMYIWVFLLFVFISQLQLHIWYVYEWFWQSNKRPTFPHSFTMFIRYVVLVWSFVAYLTPYVFPNFSVMYLPLTFILNFRISITRSKPYVFVVINGSLWMYNFLCFDSLSVCSSHHPAFRGRLYCRSLLWSLSCIIYIYSYWIPTECWSPILTRNDWHKFCSHHFQYLAVSNRLASRVYENKQVTMELSEKANPSKCITYRTPESIQYLYYRFPRVIKYTCMVYS